MTAADDIAQALGGARREGEGWRCRCILADEHAHGDANPSFFIKDRGDGGGLLCRCTR